MHVSVEVVGFRLVFCDYLQGPHGPWRPSSSIALAASLLRDTWALAGFIQQGIHTGWIVIDHHLGIWFLAFLEEGFTVIKRARQF